MLKNIYEAAKAEIKFFTVADLLKVENLSASMTREEVLDYYFTTLDNLPTGDTLWFERAYKRGRVHAIDKASDALFRSMSDTRNGAAAALSYLKRHATQYAQEVNDNEAKDGGFTYTMNINVDQAAEAKAADDKPKVVKLKQV